MIKKKQNMRKDFLNLGVIDPRDNFKMMTVKRFCPHYMKILH